MLNKLTNNKQGESIMITKDMIINKKYVRENYPKGYKYLFSYHILNCVGLASLSSPAHNREKTRCKNS